MCTCLSSSRRHITRSTRSLGIAAVVARHTGSRPALHHVLPRRPRRRHTAHRRRRARVSTGNIDAGTHAGRVDLGHFPAGTVATGVARRRVGGAAFAVEI